MRSPIPVRVNIAGTKLKIVATGDASGGMAARADIETGDRRIERWRCSLWLAQRAAAGAIRETIPLVDGGTRESARWRMRPGTCRSGSGSAATAD